MHTSLNRGYNFAIDDKIANESAVASTTNINVAQQMEERKGKTSINRWNDLNQSRTPIKMQRSTNTGDHYQDFGGIFQEIRGSYSTPVTPVKQINYGSMSLNLSGFLENEINGFQKDLHSGSSGESNSSLNSNEGIRQPEISPTVYDAQENGSKSKSSKMINYNLRYAFNVLNESEFQLNILEKYFFGNGKNLESLKEGLKGIANSLKQLFDANSTWRSQSKIDIFINRSLMFYAKTIYIVGEFERQFYTLPHSQCALLSSLNNSIAELQWERNCERILGSRESSLMKLSRDLCNISRNMESCLVVLHRLSSLFSSADENTVGVNN